MAAVMLREPSLKMGSSLCSFFLSKLGRGGAGKACNERPTITKGHRDEMTAVEKTEEAGPTVF